MPHHLSALITISMLTALTASAAPLASEVDLFSTGDLAQCRAPLGDWTMAGEVALDPYDDKRLVWTEGATAAVNGEMGKTEDLHTAVEHGDVQLHVEFMVAKGANSGIYLMARYEIQILDSWGKEKLTYGDCGGIYQRHNSETNQGFEGHAPRVNASKPAGEWQTFDITFRAPRFDAAGTKTQDALFEKVVLNGMVLHENVPVTGPTRSGTFTDEQSMGPLMFQGDHGPIALRNVRLTPLK